MEDDAVKGDQIDRRRGRCDGVVVLGERLTQRELQVLAMLADGAKRHEIATALGTTVRTVASIRAKLLKKLGARSEPHAAAIAFRRGLIGIDRRTG
jgi:DNA-binding NarL/FixJ family response regulator